MEKKKTAQRAWDKSEIMNEIMKYRPNPTADDVLDHLLGDLDYLGDSEYTVYKYSSDNRSMISRINMLWFFPLFALTIPFQWLFLGQIGISRNSKIGKIVDKLIKFD